MAPHDEWIEVGYVPRPHGIRGELKVRLHNPESEVLLDSAELGIARRGNEALKQFQVASRRPVQGGLLLRLEGIGDRSAAEALVGATIHVRREQLPELEQDEYYHFQLIGLEAIDEDGKHLGRLVEIIETGANDVYVIRGKPVGELLVPVIDRYLGPVDLEAGRLTILHPDDLRAR